MNKKEIKRLMRQEIESHLKDKAPTMNWDYIANEREKEQQIVFARKPLFAHYRLALSAVFTLIIAFSIFWLTQGIGPNPTPQPSGVEVFESEKEVLPLSFLSTAALLPTQNNLSSSTIKLISNTTSPIDPIKPFLGLIEMIFSQSQGPEIEVLTSDLETYETLVIMHTYDLLGLPITYQMYYNVISYHEDEEESTFEIEGLMKSSHMTYPMTGSKEVEDGEEKIVVKGFIDESSYIETIYETEEDESKYSIRQVQNQEVIYQSNLKVENEFDEIKITMEMENESEKSSYEMTYEFEGDQGTVKIEFESYSYLTQTETSGEMKVSVLYDDLTQLSTYQFTVKVEDDEYIEDYERDVKHDDEEEDDEDEEDEEEDEDDEEDETQENEDEDDEEDEDR